MAYSRTTRLAKSSASWALNSIGLYTISNDAGGIAEPGNMNHILYDVRAYKFVRSEERLTALYIHNPNAILNKKF